MIRICGNCKNEKEHHAKGLCYTCYKKVKWAPKTASCKRCKKTRPLHAKALCASCYNYVFHKDKAKAYHHRKSSGIDLKTYRRVTTSCVICGFDKVVDIHHIDKNKTNNHQKNLIGLCPNHHRMINLTTYRPELHKILQEKGYYLPLDEPQTIPLKTPQPKTLLTF